MFKANTSKSGVIDGNEREEAVPPTRLAEYRWVKVRNPVDPTLPPRGKAPEVEQVFPRPQKKKQQTKQPATAAPPSASTIRAERAEAEVERLRKQLAEMSTVTPTTPVSSKSTMRALQAEAEAERLHKELLTKQSIASEAPRKAVTPICKFFGSPRGCNRGSSCDFLHITNTNTNTNLNSNSNNNKEVQTKKKKKRLQHAFSAIHQQMTEQVAQMKLSFSEELQSANRLELVLLMDCTGSMSAWMAATQTQLCTIVDDVKRAYHHLDVRVGFVGYRDFCDDDERLVVSPLTTDVQKVKRCIRSQAAKGGGDGPEDVEGALEAALHLNWGEGGGGARVVILAGDAPCHGAFYHVRCFRNASASSPFCSCDDEVSQTRMQLHRPRYIETLLQRLATQGVDVHFLEINPQATSRMSAVFQEAFETAPLPPDGYRRTFTVQNMSQTDAVKRIGVTIAALAKRSVEASKSRTSAKVTSEMKRASSSSSTSGGDGVSGRKSRLMRLHTVHESDKDGIDDDDDDGDDMDDMDGGDVSRHTVSLVQAPIDWSRMTNVPATRSERAIRHSFVCKPTEDETVDWSHLSLRHVRQETQVRLCHDYFAQGAMRTAHMLLDNHLPDRYLVGKIYKTPPAGGHIVSRQRQLEQDVKTQVVSKLLARAYSVQESAECPIAVDFLTTCYYELVDRPVDDPFRFVSAEPYIAGTYTKYSNNNGWVSSEFSQTAAAFSHFTWQHTCGALMVVDLQGVNYILTDPQIHSLEDADCAFGAGNLGLTGMTAFFATHQCNAICRQLGLHPLDTKVVPAETITTAGENETAVGEFEEEKRGHTDETQWSSVELSCLLCGGIHQTERKEMVRLSRQGRSVYCAACVSHMKNDRRDIVCDTCHCLFAVSPYWYVMIGMEMPKSCKLCRTHDGSSSVAVSVKG